MNQEIGKSNLDVIRENSEKAMFALTNTPDVEDVILAYGLLQFHMTRWIAELQGPNQEQQQQPQSGILVPNNKIIL